MKNTSPPAARLNPELLNYISTLESEFGQIPAERKSKLEELGSYIAGKSAKGSPVNITVICTHNSRRSHIGQLWLKAGAEYYGIEDFHAFSGGTEATAFYKTAMNALKTAGFGFTEIKKGGNPVYECSLGKELPKIKMFSKKYDHVENPPRHFAALMVCTSADEACPFVAGADARFSIPYLDPKAFDGTPQEENAYAERCRQIAREMFYAVKVGGLGY